MVQEEDRDKGYKFYYASREIPCCVTGPGADNDSDTSSEGEPDDHDEWLQDKPKQLDDATKLRYLITAISAADIVQVKELLKLDIDVNKAPKRDTNPPLHHALLQDVVKQEILELLLAQGADPNLPNWMGFAPLHIAVNRGNKAAAVLLEAAGADINVVITEGKTLLHKVVEKIGDENIIRLLLELGANPNLVDTSGKIAADYVQLPGDAAILALLQTKMMVPPVLNSIITSPEETETLTDNMPWEEEVLSQPNLWFSNQLALLAFLVSALAFMAVELGTDYYVSEQIVQNIAIAFWLPTTSLPHGLMASICIALAMGMVISLGVYGLSEQLELSSSSSMAMAY